MIRENRIKTSFSLWKKIIGESLLFLLFFSLPLSAQTNRVLRDSLATASERVAYHPDSIDLRLRKASWNIMLEQWSFARDEYDYILLREPDNIAALYYRAFVNEKLGRLNFARLDYENLLKRVPGNFEAQLGLALLNEKDHHYTEAFNQINQLIDQFPNNPIAYAARAGIEKERKMYELAEYDYGEAIKRDITNIDYILNRSDVRYLLSDYVGAREDLDRVVNLGISRANLRKYYNRLKIKRKN
ncbi:tetratricopeptide repeat protein [Hoylesella pleuritidis]|jgi:tetratricopeptide repeat protein|nr:hypothetical protein [Hoylesella pleuritidis]